MNITAPSGASSSNPTAEAYSELQAAFDHYNQTLFGGQLPACLITLHRESKKTFGLYAYKRFVGIQNQTDSTDEIAMNPLHFGSRNIREILATLAHEMVHLWQFHFGKPSRRSYHNREWAAKMKEIGLFPSNTGEPGGKEVGQQMTHYVIDGGRFDTVTRDLIAGGFYFSWADRPQEEKPKDDDGKVKTKSGKRLKYTCPECHANAWGKSGLNLICGKCRKNYVLENQDHAANDED